MNNYIYYIFVLKECIEKIIGIHYPMEIIALIIMSIYKHKQISCGSYHTILLSDKIYVWGDNWYGQLGLGDRKGCSSPTELCLREKIKLISCGWRHTIALTYVPNKLYVWGANIRGELGLGHTQNRISPTELVLPMAIRSVHCGGCYTIALTTILNKLYVWGDNEFGQLGVVICNGQTKQSSPQELIFSEQVIAISCGGYHNIALAYSNKIYTWGSNDNGQLGLGNYNNKYTPTKLNFHKSIQSVNCGFSHTVVLTTTNEIYVWGRNCEGQLGCTKQMANSPKKLNFDKLITSIHCSTSHTFVLTNIGECYMSHVYMPRIYVFHEPIVSINCNKKYIIILTKTEKVYTCKWKKISEFVFRELKF